MVVRVNQKGAVHEEDPRRVVAGTVTPFLTWALFVALAGGSWGGILFWAVIGGLCGWAYARFNERVLPKNEVKRLGTQLAPDSSSLLLYVHGSTGEALLDDVAPEDPRLASVATIGSDLSAAITSGAQQPTGTPSTTAASAPPKSNGLLNMLMFRYAGTDAAGARQRARPSADQAKAKHATVQTEVLLRVDKDGRDHVVNPGTGVRAFMPSDAIGWGVFGLIFGAIVGFTRGGGVTSFVESTLVTGILWAHLRGLHRHTLRAVRRSLHLGAADQTAATAPSARHVTRALLGRRPAERTTAWLSGQNPQRNNSS